MIKVVYQYTGMRFTIQRAWVNWTNGEKEQINWHTHPNSDVSLVYYMDIPLPFFSNGTLFRDKFIKVPQNSLLLFPSSMEHTAPPSPLRFDRYTMALSLIYDF